MTDREKTIEALRCLIGDANPVRSHRILTEIEEGRVPGVGADEGWIATGEKSPANLADVLVTSRECGIRVAWRTESGTWWNGAKRIDKPTHWRPLPKGPSQ